MDKAGFILFGLLIALVYLYENRDKSTVKVLPIGNYQDFLIWYKETIDIYPVSDKDLQQYFLFWDENINKRK